MKKYIGHIIFMRILLLCPLVTAQSGFYVPQTAKIFFGGDSSTIFSDVINDGLFGIGKKSFINFAGLVWKNDPNALIVDETYFPGPGTLGIIIPGSWVRFMSTHSMQTIIGGYNAATKSGPSFLNIDIQNPNGVQLAESNLKVRTTVKMTSGKVFLRSYIFTVGDNYPGVIIGYDSTRFFITDNTPGSGFLLRENITRFDGRIDFPVGTSQNSYTPLAIRSVTAAGDDYYATVFNGVKPNITEGPYLNEESVTKTWQLGKTKFPNAGEIEIFLQHINSDEGAYFQKNRQFAYVSQYKDSMWDVGASQFFPDSGYLTKGTSLMGSGVNKRTFSNSVSNSSFFTKLTGEGTKLWLTGWRTNKDLVNLNWRTNPEAGLKYFVVERKLSSENTFSSRDTVLSKTPNQMINMLHIYDSPDSNNYPAISFYRLKLVNSNNGWTYSPVIAIGNRIGSYVNMLWPNPSQGKFTISLDPGIQLKEIILTNILGQKVMKEEVRGRTIIEMGENGKFKSGTYFLSLISAQNVILETKKLIIINK